MPKPSCGGHPNSPRCVATYDGAPGPLAALDAPVILPNSTKTRLPGSCPTQAEGCGDAGRSNGRRYMACRCLRGSAARRSGPRPAAGQLEASKLGVTCGQEVVARRPGGAARHGAKCQDPNGLRTVRSRVADPRTTPATAHAHTPKLCRILLRIHGDRRSQCSGGGRSCGAGRVLTMILKQLMPVSCVATRQAARKFQAGWGGSRVACQRRD